MVKVSVLLVTFLLLPGNISSVLDQGSAAPAGLEAVVDFLDQDPCTRECEGPPACPEETILIRPQASQDANTNDDIIMPCDDGDCEDHIGGCGTSEEEDLVAVAGPDAFLFLKERYPEKVHLNMDRGAVQLLDCAGRVSAHVPVSDALLRNLARIEL